MGRCRNKIKKKINDVQLAPWDFIPRIFPCVHWNPSDDAKRDVRWTRPSSREGAGGISRGRPRTHECKLGVLGRGEPLRWSTEWILGSSSGRTTGRELSDASIVIKYTFLKGMQSVVSSRSIGNTALTLEDRRTYNGLESDQWGLLID